MREYISVIIPIYNVEPYVCQCIESVCKQTYKNLEIILVDDGSDDRSPEICDEFAGKDSRIKVIHKQNEGLARARKTGLQAATSDYIAYVDGDDWIESNMVEQLYETLISETVDVVMCGRYEDTGDSYREVYHGVAEGRYDKAALKEKVYPNMIVNGAFFEWGIFPSVWDKLFRRECLEKYQMQVDDRLTMGEDAACTYPCLLNAESIYVMHECLYHYRQTATSMVKQVENVELQRQRFQILYNSVLVLFEQNKDIYDLSEQWKEYLLFIMVPRSGTLYRGIEKLEYLFPFPNVKKGSNVIIYGMGVYGQHLYNFIKKTEFCNILICVDQNYIELRKQGFPVDSPDDIGKYDYEVILVANSFAKVRNVIYKDLIRKYPSDKVQIIDEELIKSEETKKAFGLV